MSKTVKRDRRPACEARIGQRGKDIAAVMLGMFLAAGLTSCGGGGGDSETPDAPASPPAAAPSPPVTETPKEALPTAMTSVPVIVPVGMRSAPFDTERTLTAPEGVSIRVIARVNGARFMAVAPNGDLLVSNPGSGRVLLLRMREDGTMETFTFASGLTSPHDIVFHVAGGTTYVYIAQSNRIVRTVYNDGDTAAAGLQTVVDDLPDVSTPELNGTHLHRLKNIALREGKLYVSLASSCNICVSDTTADPVRAAIYEYDLDGANGRLFARGLRNAEGLAFRPGTSELWVTVNGRDRIAYPFHDDWDGDGRDDYGRVMQSYVDDHPPDLLTRVRDGGNYGWPFCNPNPDSGPDNMPFDADVETNADNSRFDCASADRPTKGLPAHSAPLGMSFLQGVGLPPALDNSVAVALHGCWNCSELNGHNIAIYPLRADGSVGAPVDLVTGWVTNARDRVRWGRPVDVVPDRRGGLYVSDDFSGTVYRVAFDETDNTR